VNFSCHSIGASDLKFIGVIAKKKRLYVCTDTFSNAYNDTKIIYNKVVYVPRNNARASFRISYFTGPS